MAAQAAALWDRKTMQRIRARTEGRILSAITVAVLHIALGYALVTGLAPDAIERITQRLKTFDISEPPAPPPVPPPRVPPQAVRNKADKGAGAPPGLKAESTPLVALSAEVRLERRPPMTSAPVAGQGFHASPGASDRAGSGPGAGGAGSGTGSGRHGTGNGGGIAVPAQPLKGRITGSDYPRAARQARAEGMVHVRFVVGTNGRASGCAVTRSSGNAELDETTCRLIERRFRYRPAQDAQGNAVPDAVIGTQRWWIDPLD